MLLARKRAFFSVGRKEGRYVRVGRFVLWWYGFRRDSELCAAWWLDRKHRNATNGLTIKPPWCPPLYSEDYGKHRPYLRLFGWRVMRTAAYIVAISRVATVTRMRGMYA